MRVAFFYLLTSFLFTINNAENPSYDQGAYRPDYLNYCFEDREECSKNVCNCVLDKKCMIRPLPYSAAEAILSQHNAIRKQKSNFEPKASGMPKLEYDAQLESIAQCWAAKCKNERTDCLLTESYSKVGMNKGTISREKTNTAPFLESPYSDTKPIIELWKVIVKEWTKNVYLMPPNEIFDSSKEEPGAQVLHDRTLAIGCAWSASPEGSFFFCAYGPGLENDTVVYRSGSPCSTCPAGYKCNENSGEMCVRYSLYPQVRITAPPAPKQQRRLEPMQPPALRISKRSGAGGVVAPKVTAGAVCSAALLMV